MRNTGRMRQSVPLTQRGVPLVVFFMLVGTLLILSIGSVSAADPVFLNLPENFTIFEDNLTVIFVFANDSDGDYPLNFSTTVQTATQFPRFHIENYNSTTGLINFTPLNEDVGSGTNLKVQIVVADSVNDATLRTVQFIIVNTNDAPNITGWSPIIPTPTINENASLGFQFDYNASDDDLIHVPSLDNLSNVYWFDGISYTTNQTWNYTPGFCDAGYHNVTLIVSDLYNASDQKTWNITVNNTNRMPFLNVTIGNFTWIEDTNFTDAINLTDHFFDPDNLECTGTNKDDLSFTASGNNSVRVIIDEATFKVTFAPDPDWYGVEYITFTASDGYNTSVSNIVVVNVTNVNDPPTMTPIGNHTTAENAPFSYQVNATDNDTQTLFYWDNTTLFDISVAGLISFTPSDIQIGVHSINITVGDGEFNISSILNLTVLDNTAPVLTVYPQQNLTEGVPFVMNIMASDVNDDSMTFTDNTTFFNITDLNATWGRISFTPDNDMVGDHTIRITATDSWGASNYTDILFSVANVNNTPVLAAIGDLLWRTNNSFFLQLTASDADDDALIWGINSSLFNLTNVSNGVVNINFTPGFGDWGNHTIRVNVSDGIATDFEVFTFTIINNSLPLIVNATNLTVMEDSPLFKVFQVNDTDNDSISFSLNASFFSIADYTHQHAFINFTPDYTQVGNHTLRINVSDGWKGKAEAIFILRVIERNDPPYWDPPLTDLNSFEGKLFTTYLNARDEENDTLTFSTNSTLFNITKINATTAIINFTPTFAQVDNYSVILNVSDGTNHNYSIITFRVLVTNDVPIIDATYPASSNVTLQENSTQLFNVTVTDPESQPLYYWWSIDGTFNTTTATFTYRPSFSSAGIRNISVIIGDTVHNVSTSWTVNVTNLNRVPRFGVQTLTVWNSGTHTDTESVSGILRLYDNGTFLPSGSHNSSAINLIENAGYHNITFLQPSINLPNGTNVTFETRTSATVDGFGSWNITERDPNNSSRWTVHANHQQYIQLRINLTTVDTSISPNISYVDVHYGIDDFDANEKTTTIWVDLDDYFSDPDNDDSFTYNYSATGSMTVTIEAGTNLARIYADGPRTATVQFSATDSNNATAYSNNVTVTFIDLPEGTQDVSTGGSSGGGSFYITITKTKLVNQSSNKTQFFSLEILNPGTITIYENQSMHVRLFVENNDNRTFTNLTFVAVSGGQVLNFSFDPQMIERLLPGETADINLTIDSYYNYGNYEVIIEARVQNPKYTDRLKLFISALELGSENLSQLNTRITFTQDLFDTNPECLELNELLVRARDAIAGNRYRTAGEYLDQAIEGCKFLINRQDINLEYPLRTRGFFGAIAAFFERVWRSVFEFFSGLFG